MCFFSPSTVFLTTARQVGQVTRPLSWISKDHCSSMLPVKRKELQSNWKYRIFLSHQCARCMPRGNESHATKLVSYSRSFSSLLALNASWDKAHITPLGRWFHKSTQHCFLFVRRVLAVQQRFLLHSFSLQNYFSMHFWQNTKTKHLTKVVTDVTEQFLGQSPWFNSTKRILRASLMSDSDFGTKSEKSCTTTPILSILQLGKSILWGVVFSAWPLLKCKGEALSTRIINYWYDFWEESGLKATCFNPYHKNISLQK